MIKMKTEKTLEAQQQMLLFAQRPMLQFTLILMISALLVFILDGPVVSHFFVARTPNTSESSHRFILFFFSTKGKCLISILLAISVFAGARFPNLRKSHVIVVLALAITTAIWLASIAVPSSP